MVSSHSIDCGAGTDLGQGRRYTLQTHMLRHYDGSIFKNFAMTGESTLSFRAEAFNVPDRTSSSAAGAAITSSSCCAVTPASIPSRGIRPALKHDF